MRARVCMHACVGGVGGAQPKCFTSCLTPSPAISTFNTTVSLSIGERTAPPDVGIVERCEPAAVKLSAGV